MEPTLLRSDRTGLVLAHNSLRLAIAGGWMLLIFVLGLLWLLRDLFEPWWWMWLVAFTIFFGFKVLTLLNLDATSRQALNPGRLAAYFFLWPGLRPSVFVGQTLMSGARQKCLAYCGVDWSGFQHGLISRSTPVRIRPPQLQRSEVGDQRSGVSGEA